MPPWPAGPWSLILAEPLVGMADAAQSRVQTAIKDFINAVDSVRLCGGLL